MKSIKGYNDTRPEILLRAVNCWLRIFENGGFVQKQTYLQMVLIASV